MCVEYIYIYIYIYIGVNTACMPLAIPTFHALLSIGASKPPHLFFVFGGGLLDPVVRRMIYFETAIPFHPTSYQAKGHFTLVSGRVEPRDPILDPRQGPGEEKRDWDILQEFELDWTQASEARPPSAFVPRGLVPLWWLGAFGISESPVPGGSVMWLLNQMEVKNQDCVGSLGVYPTTSVILLGILPLMGGLVFGKPGWLYHRRGFQFHHSPQICVRTPHRPPRRRRRSRRRAQGAVRSSWKRGARRFGDGCFGANFAQGC